MKTTDRIEVGDIVQVDFNNSQITLCRSAIVIAKPFVLSHPFAIGEHWVFRDNETGLLHYVSEPCTISKKINTSTVP